ncbi:ABC transporter ATP-binding protein [Stappia sp. TSB10GB4]|uniref:ABC transporter ATP-binding protein n=1 Tax=Stappia sp. TSB10GB4 TaxID=2003584 RepID=UPI001644801C|nr:ABC transporter ATP-binding protein [Stappia sp. TSB10GB4]
MSLPATAATTKQVVLAVDGLRLEARIGALVEDVSLALEEGEMMGLVGESGSGKTITALSILGLLPAAAVRHAAGDIRFRGRSLSGLSETEFNAIRGRDIAMIFQEPMTSLNPIMTIGAQIGEVLEIHRGLTGTARRDDVLRLLDLVGLPASPDQLDRYPFQLSGGQRQRVMIAMAIACEPAVLIADEPTTALDVTIQAQILELIARMRERFGMACLLVTHDLGVVAETCDTVAVMYAGRVVEQGPVAAVFRTPLHRYTEALLRSIPAANPPGVSLPAIPGTVPAPGARPPGCAFADRCGAVIARCRADLPPRITRDDRVAYCWNPAA